MYYRGMNATTATCRHCGATFAASRTGRTVYCPDHRDAAARRTAKPKANADSCFVCYGTGNYDYHPTLAPTAAFRPCHNCHGTGRKAH